MKKVIFLILLLLSINSIGLLAGSLKLTKDENNKTEILQTFENVSEVNPNIATSNENNKNNSKFFTRQGISAGFGFGETNIDWHEGIDWSDLGHTLFIANNMEMYIELRYVYLGLELENYYAVKVTSNGADRPNNGVLAINSFTSNLFFVFGFSLPFRIKNTIVIPYIDLRISPKENNYPVAGAGIGIELKAINNNTIIKTSTILLSWKPIQENSPYGHSYIIFSLGIWHELGIFHYTNYK